MLLTVLDVSSKLEGAIKVLVEHGAELGLTIIKASIVFLVGRLVINLLNKLVKKILSKRDIDMSVKTFVGSLVNVSLTILLIISVVGALGVQTTSFAALLASAGVAVGMALSGNLSNFAGGLIVLLFKPYKVGDLIEAQGVSGVVKEVQMFHTVLTTADNKTIYVPNGSLSSGVVTNFSAQATRRVDWTFGVEYGSDYEQVKQVIESVLAKGPRPVRSGRSVYRLDGLGGQQREHRGARLGEQRGLLGRLFRCQQEYLRHLQRGGHRLPLPAAYRSSRERLMRKYCLGFSL